MWIFSSSTILPPLPTQCEELRSREVPWRCCADVWCCGAVELWRFPEGAGVVSVVECCECCGVCWLVTSTLKSHHNPKKLKKIQKKSKSRKNLKKFMDLKKRLNPFEPAQTCRPSETASAADRDRRRSRPRPQPQPTETAAAADRDRRPIRSV